MKKLIWILPLVILFSCKKDKTIIDKIATPPKSTHYYFPAIGSNSWSTLSMNDLNWDASDTTALYDFLSQHETRAFIILYKGKIVVEKYWGNNLLNNGPFLQSSQWYWASAGKTITAFLVGLAQQKGLLNINDRTSDYLGEN